MGIAQAGIAFRISASVEDLAGFIAAVFGEAATPMPLPVSERFDIRNHSDVMVQTFGDICFISNDDLAWPLLRRVDADATRLHAVLGRPDLMLAFCHYDAGGSHGYAVFEHGRRRRTRLQTCNLPDLPALMQAGAPLPFEQRWLDAQHYVEADGAAPADATKVYFLGNREVVVPARELTGRMLQDGLDALFGVCPWETLLTPTYRFYRLGPDRPRHAAPAVSRAKPSAAAKRPWWHLG